MSLQNQIAQELSQMFASVKLGEVYTHGDLFAVEIKDGNVETKNCGCPAIGNHDLIVKTGDKPWQEKFVLCYPVIGDCPSLFPCSPNRPFICYVNSDKPFQIRGLEIKTLYLPPGKYLLYLRKFK